MTPEEKKELMEDLKVSALDTLEEAVVELVDKLEVLVTKWLPKVSASVAAIAIPVFGFIKPQLLKLVDKIDGEDDEGR